MLWHFLPLLFCSFMVPLASVLSFRSCFIDFAAVKNLSCSGSDLYDQRSSPGNVRGFSAMLLSARQRPHTGFSCLVLCPTIAARFRPLYAILKAFTAI